MSAWLAGLDLADLLLRVSLGERPPPAPESRPGVRTHIALQALLGSALRGGSRRAVAAEAWRLLTGSGSYAGSREELTPLRFDPPSVVPTLAAAVMVLARPQAAQDLPKKGWGAHLLNPESVRTVRERIGPATPEPGDGRSGG